MQRVSIAGGVELSRLVYGMWRLADDPDVSEARVTAKVEACLAQGITTFDQADIYCDYASQEVFGRALKASPGLRDRIEVISKCGILLTSGRHPHRRVKHYDTGPDHVRASVETALRDMGLEALDLLLIHRPDPLMDAGATGRVLDDLVAEGKARAVGVSNFRPWDWDLLQSAMTTTLATNQLELSLLARDAFTNGDLVPLQRLGRPAMAWSPLGGGRIFTRGEPAVDRLRPRLKEIADGYGVGIDGVALAWLLRHPVGILPVAGTNNLERLARIADCFRVEIDRETWFELWELAEGREVP